MVKGSLAVVVACIALAGTAAAEDADQLDCFDAIVSARVVEQVPSDPGNMADDLFAWPWFIDLDVDRVVKGEAPKGRMTVLTIQHTYFNANQGVRRWWLRRNSAGTFNLLRFDDDKRPTRCAKDAPPAHAYLQPIAGSTLADLRQKGERRWGRSSDRAD